MSSTSPQEMKQRLCGSKASGERRHDEANDISEIRSYALTSLRIRFTVPENSDHT